ncbi:UNVERIFIED_CONTAM: hypothetical protein IGO34_27645, partial [Salmonella enterica subsp. enterica serovar Weltevreden]
SIEEQLPPVLDRLHGAVEHPFPLPEGPARIGMSAGVAVSGGASVDAAALFRSSDEALYRAKARAAEDRWWCRADLIDSEVSGAAAARPRSSRAQ